jgi:antitoxin StbD
MAHHGSGNFVHSDVYLNAHFNRSPAMQRLATNQICSITELREPQKVLDAAGGKPVAILKNSALVAYIVPAVVVDINEHRPATMEEVTAYLRDSQARVQPVLDYLKDK